MHYYHHHCMSREGSIVATVNNLFGRKWEVFASYKHGTDSNTLPSMANAVRNEQYTGAMALSTIADEIMLDDSISCVVYSNDGSSQGVTGTYVVLSLTVDGVQRSLSTFGIFIETRGSLKELNITTFAIFAAASCGHRYRTSEIL